jgi:dUTP pyrophosphatase
MQIKIKRLTPDAIIPTYAHEGDAGADLYSGETVTIKPFNRGLIDLIKLALAQKLPFLFSKKSLQEILEERWKFISTGISVEIPLGGELQVRSKSGLAGNFGVVTLNSPGTIDSGYRGEIKGLLINFGSKPYTVKKGSKIAQLVSSPNLGAEFVESDNFSDSFRGEGGFGSTGLSLSVWVTGSSEGEYKV